MGTRSTITFKKDGEFLCNIYQQFDGYVEGVGNELKNFIKSGVLVNGYTHELGKRQFNGAGCLVAQYIEQFKDGVGGLYITTEQDTQEYNYVVNIREHNCWVMCVEDEDFEEVIRKW